MGFDTKMCKRGMYHIINIQFKYRDTHTLWIHIMYSTLCEVKRVDGVV